MTANEMRYNLLLGVDNLLENGAPGYSDTQITAILNRAQRRVFKDKRKLFDRSEEIKRMLSPLLSRGSLIEGDIVESADQTYIHPNGVFYTLPENADKIIEEYVTLDEGTSTSDPVIVLPITYDYYVKNYNSRYKKPYANLIWRLDYVLENGAYTVELITDASAIIEDYVISYLRFPADIVVNTSAPASAVDCEIIDVGFHDEVVAEAIKIVVAALNDEGYQVAGAERNFDGN